MSTKPRPPVSRQAFIKTFDSIARHKHRYEVFRDFVTMAAISLHNAMRKDEVLEAEYLRIVARYSKEEVNGFCELLAELVMLLDPEPIDVLGGLYMELELANEHAGQFFTPPEISELMARMTYGDAIRNIEGEFITLSEPACGAGGMVLAFVKVMLSHGHDPGRRVWVMAQDVDRLAALMCYLQLSLWNIPAAVIVGNTLALEAREVFYTPAHYLGLWDAKLRRRAAEQTEANAACSSAVPAPQPDRPSAETQEAPPAVAEKSKIEMPLVPSGTSVQFDFGF